MTYTPRQFREVFHFLFLKKLLQISDPHLYVLKGGVNLRFFFLSPRYSEDMDLDVLGGSVSTLKKNGYRILQEPALKRSLATFGIEDLIINDPEKAKHTQTTQRFGLSLVTSAGESYPTRVEFSHRAVQEEYQLDPIDPQIARPYLNLSYSCQHFTAESMLKQKLIALANRAAPQTRDVFDLYILWLGGHIAAAPVSTLSADEASRALENLMSFSYKDYEGQVLEYLEPEQRDEYAGDIRWNQICDRVLSLIPGDL